MTPPEVSAWLWWLLIVGALSAVWYWGSRALDGMERRASQRRHPSRRLVDLERRDRLSHAERAAWQRIVAGTKD